MPTYRTPGVYIEDVLPPLASQLRTGVPVFLGLAESGPVNTPQMHDLWSQFGETFGGPLSGGYLAHAVRGFFANGGRQCYVVRLDDATTPETAVRRGLEEIAALDTIDLVCAPDVMKNLDRAPVLQRMVLEHCETSGDRFAILDSLPGVNVRDVLSQRRELSSSNGAIYYPWVGVRDGSGSTDRLVLVPPCGHVAGVYARSDESVGVHKAPANEVLEGVLDLEVNPTNAQQDQLNPEGVNCLRAFPGRGIRVWGARTLSSDSAWTYVNVRRLFLTAGRWVERNMSGITFEPNDETLWARIQRDLTVYFNDMFRRGALKGSTPQEAFYIKCDAQTNSPDARGAGTVVTEIGLAPAAPGEFVIVRIISDATGVTITGPAGPQ